MIARKWTLIHTPRIAEDGHKLHRRSDGAVSITDWSGETPDETDDGPLIVEPGTIVTVHYEKPYGVIYIVPSRVERDGGRIGRVWSGPETMRALSKAVDVRVEYDASFKRIQKEVFFAGMLSPAFA